MSKNKLSFSIMFSGYDFHWKSTKIAIRNKLLGSKAKIAFGDYSLVFAVGVVMISRWFFTAQK